jgi:hypothetical protein
MERIALIENQEQTLGVGMFKRFFVSRICLLASRMKFSIGAFKISNQLSAISFGAVVISSGLLLS